MMTLMRYLVNLVRAVLIVATCRHEFVWQPVDGYRFDQLVCTKCGTRYSWEAGH